MKDEHYIIREAEPRDADTISRLFWESDNYHFQNVPHIYRETKESFRSSEYLQGLMEEEKSLFYILEKDGVSLGFIYAYEEKKGFLPFHRKRTYLYIDNIVISREHQHKGYGVALLDSVIEESKKRNYSDIMLNVYSFNENAIALYQKKGFSELSRDFILPL